MDSENVGTAIGICFCIGNIGKSVAPIIVGQIKDNSTTEGGYYWVMIFFILTGSFGFIMSNILMFLDYCKGGKILFDPQLKKSAETKDQELKQLENENETEEQIERNKN